MGDFLLVKWYTNGRKNSWKENSADVCRLLSIQNKNCFICYEDVCSRSHADVYGCGVGGSRSSSGCRDLSDRLQ